MDLGLERAGMECAWQVEIDEFCRKVLTKHWPNVPKFNDVREVGKHNLEPVDLIAGGFPCQDISYAGDGAGIDGSRSGLWREFARIVCELRPRFVLVENSPALLNRGMGRVLGDLATGGYDAEWSVLPACAMGAPHSRERVFLIADSDGKLNQRRTQVREERWANVGMDVMRGQWTSEPSICRVVDGIPDRVDRLKSLGNAVVPQWAQWIGERIIKAALNVPAR